MNSKNLLEDLVRLSMSKLTPEEIRLLRERFGEESPVDKLPSEITDTIDEVSATMSLCVEAAKQYKGKLPIADVAAAVRELLYGELKPVFEVIRDALFDVEEAFLLKHVDWLKMLQNSHNLSEETALRILELNTSAVKQLLTAGNTSKKK